MCKETKHLEHEMSSAVQAQSYIRRMVEKETKGWGDTLPALERLERRYGISFWTMNNIRIGRAKTVEGGILRRIKLAYLDMCERQLKNLQHELEMEGGHNGDDFDSHLLAEVQSLAAKVTQAKKGMRA
jgi:hypothetical protein